jgi:membrane protein
VPSESSRGADDVLESSSESARSVGATLKQTLDTVRERGMTDWAASLTYYAILSVFPMLIALVSLLGIFGEYPRTSNALIKIVQQVAPGSTVDVLRGPIEHGAKNQSGAGLIFLIGIGASIWAASGYLGAFFRAANIAWDATEDRPIWKLRPIQVVLTVILLAGLTLIGMALVITGPVATAVGDSIGLGSTTLTVWRWVKWPVIVLAVLTLLSLVFYTAPNVKQRGYRWISAGTIAAAVGWVIATALFGLYVAYFGSYNKTYGSIAGVIIFLVWMWITNLALLFGVTLDAVRARSAS